jgi:hypothetical protein
MEYYLVNYFSQTLLNPVHYCEFIGHVIDYTINKENFESIDNLNQNWTDGKSDELFYLPRLELVNNQNIFKFFVLENPTDSYLRCFGEIVV